MEIPNTKRCFVIIGYGEKVDLASQRRLNLDRVFENIIKPVFDSFNDPKFVCFRACDENFGGVIDVQMYKWILEADFVIADISTLNPNAIYELGIRHALRPCSTLVIAEDGIKDLPFDISHVKIDKYRHLGEDIGVAEARRFITILRGKVQQMLDNQICDSPVYTYIQKLRPPYFDLSEPREGQTPDLRSKLSMLTVTDIPQNKKDVSLSDLIKSGEKSIQEKKFHQALALFKEAELRDPSNPFLKHRIILTTYKSEIPDIETALRDSISLLGKHFDTEKTLDSRTLGLVAVTNKKLAEIEYEKATVASVKRARILAYNSVEKYEKLFALSGGFFVGSGLSLALLLTGVVEPDLVSKHYLLIKACVVAKKVNGICKYRIDQEKGQGRASKKLRIVFEALVRSDLVLTNGEVSPETGQVINQLLLLQNAQQRLEFSERSEKTVKYVKSLREDLKSLPQSEKFL